VFAHKMALLGHEMHTTYYSKPAVDPGFAKGGGKGQTMVTARSANLNGGLGVSKPSPSANPMPSPNPSSSPTLLPP